MSRVVIAISMISLALGGVACSDDTHSPAGPYGPTSTCRSDSVTSCGPISLPISPLGQAGTITGIVTERTLSGSTPLANVEISAWVRRGNQTAWDYPVKSDSTGHFTLENIPENDSVLLNPASAEADDHPCGSVSQSRGVITIELVPTDHPLLDAATALPRITGVAYEVTASGRQPVAGAQISFYANDDLIEATTTTDELGRYALCNLFGYYANQLIYAQKEGYQLFQQVVSVSGSQQIDLEMKH